MKKQLEAVQDLQNQINEVEKSIGDVEATFNEGPELAAMRSHHKSLTAAVEDLYNKLDVAEGFPELVGHTPDFARLLLQVHECKRQVQRLATAHLQEVENIDQAVQGRRNPLGEFSATSTVHVANDIAGTKMHQKARRSIAKRQPALTRAIERFNSLVTQLNRRRPRHSRFPAFQQLPLDLRGLRESETLFQDMWMAAGDVPDWARDQTVRDGVRALQVQDRCLEERLRLRKELQHMSSWYTVEHVALQLLKASTQGQHRVQIAPTIF